MPQDFSHGAAWMKGTVIPVSEAKISVFDWGLTRSDITYDVVHVWQGSFFRLDDYLDRFMVSMEKLRLDVGMDRSAIRAALPSVTASARCSRFCKILNDASIKTHNPTPEGTFSQRATTLTVRLGSL